MLSGATDLEKRHGARGHCRSRCAGCCAGFAGRPASRVTELTPGRSSTSCCRRGRPRARRAPEPEPAGGDAQPELGLGTLPAPRGAAGQPALLHRARGLPALRLPLLPRAGAAACRGVDVAARARRPLPEAGARRAAARHARARAARAARLRAARASRREAEVAELIESHGADACGRRRWPTCATWSSASSARELRERIARGASACAPSCRSPSRWRRRAPAGAACSSTASSTCTPTSPTALLVVDYKSDALEGRDPAELTAESLLDPAARLRARRAARRRRAGRGRLLLPRAARAAGRRPPTRPRTPTGSRRSCSSSPPAWSRAASSRPPSRTWSCAATAPGGPRCAPGTRSTRSSSA